MFNGAAKTMLSAVLQLLRSVVHETSKDRRTSIMELCAAAYPDVQAWQVEKTSIAAGGKGPESLYYQYLSLLLHPIDGNELARRDASLIKVSRFWCVAKRLLNSGVIFVRNGVNYPSQKCKRKESIGHSTTFLISCQLRQRRPATTWRTTGISAFCWNKQ
jgi:hypothetical protein